MTTITKSAQSFRILSDPTRLKILVELFRHRDGMCVGDIAGSVGITHSAASHQLAKLEANDVVSCERDGKNMCYKVCKTALTQKLKKAINALS